MDATKAAQQSRFGFFRSKVIDSVIIVRLIAPQFIVIAAQQFLQFATLPGLDARLCDILSEVCLLCCVEFTWPCSEGDSAVSHCRICVVGDQLLDW